MKRDRKKKRKKEGKKERRKWILQLVAVDIASSGVNLDLTNITEKRICLATQKETPTLKSFFPFLSWLYVKYLLSRGLILNLQ